MHGNDVIVSGYLLTDSYAFIVDDDDFEVEVPSGTSCEEKKWWTHATNSLPDISS